MARVDGRVEDALRDVKVTLNYVSTAEASVFIEVGKTRVLCNATVEDKAPKWMSRDERKGWVTAEYNLLPRSTDTRVRRERNQVSGRTQEIQRLIGRALRGVCNLEALDGRTITIDCDVIEADGGTRTTSIVGGFMALVMAVRKIPSPASANPIPRIKSWLAASSVGVVEGACLLDLCYKEDLVADVDMNVVMNDKGEFVEIQGTGEEATFDRKTLDTLLGFADKGCRELIALQKQHLGEDLP